MGPGYLTLPLLPKTWNLGTYPSPTPPDMGSWSLTLPLLPQTWNLDTYSLPLLPQTWNLGTYSSPYSSRHGSCVATLSPTPPDMGPWYSPILLTFGGHHWRPVQTCLLRDPPPFPSPVLTSSGGHRNACKWQASSTHATGMLSCL